MNARAGNSATIKSSLDEQKGTLLITALDLSVLYVNKQTTETTGFSPAETVGKEHGKLWGGSMAPSFYEHLWQVINVDKQPFVGQLHNVKKDGSLYWEQVHVAPILDDAGTVKCFIELKPPALATGREHHDFARDFISEFKHQKGNADHIIKFLFHSLSLVIPPELSGPKNGVGETVSPSRLFSFLQETLIDPTTLLYHERSLDHALISSAQLHTSAFDALYQKYFTNVESYFSQRLPDRGLAEDLAQETFLKAFTYLPRFTISNASYLTYLLHIARNQLSTFYRQRHPTSTAEDEVLMENIPTAPIDYAKLWDLETLWKGVQDLPEIDQKIVKLKYLNDLLVKDIAAKVNKSENAVKLILSRARKKLRDTFFVTEMR